jgi:hypothetical protein
LLAAWLGHQVMGSRTCGRSGLSWMPVGLTWHRHVPEASLVVGYPEEGVFSFSGLFADGGLELAINAVSRPFVARSTQLRGLNAQLRVRRQPIQALVR